MMNNRQGGGPRGMAPASGNPSDPKNLYTTPVRTVPPRQTAASATARPMPADPLKKAAPVRTGPSYEREWDRLDRNERQAPAPMPSTDEAEIKRLARIRRSRTGL